LEPALQIDPTLAFEKFLNGLLAFVAMVFFSLDEVWGEKGALIFPLLSANDKKEIYNLNV
jgi:hypothetical protein